jgi:signal transduction histidine kinase
VRGTSGPLVIAFIHDVTERKEKERQIRDYQTRLVDMAFDAAVAEERERRRIAADLHDRIGQSLAVAQMKIAAARDAFLAEPRGALDDALGLIEQTIADVRTLMFDLSPPVLYDLGLTAALAWLSETFQQKHGLAVALDARDDSSGLDPDVAALLFRTVRELLMNVVKHAGTNRASVRLRTDADAIHIAVSDAGVGFDPAGTSGRGTFGLFSAREQVIRLGGSFTVRSARGKGTAVHVRVPRTTIDGEGEE